MKNKNIENKTKTCSPLSELWNKINEFIRNERYDELFCYMPQTIGDASYNTAISYLKR